jgi:alpha-tubulin suppressor-like RCC1 family protein
MRLPTLLLAAACLLGCDRSPAEPNSPPGRVLSIVSGDQQEAPAGLPLPVAPRVLLTAADGTPQPGIEILWQVTEGGGVVNAFRTFTDSAGVASVTWTLGDDIGPQLLYASAAGTGGVTFRARSDLFFSSVSTGWRHSCGLDPRGLAWCWGDNFWGQRGGGTRTGSAASHLVAGRNRFDRVQAGMLHTCALTAGGNAYCWGDNGSGQLGDGTTRHSDVPVLVLGGHDFRSLSVGYTHTCGITQQRELYCWGNNMHGQLGVSAPETCSLGGLNAPCSRLPVRITLPAVAMSVAAGEAHSCAADGQERVYCWGLNDWGQLGIGSFGGSASAPTPVEGGVRLQELVAWGRTTCGLNAQGGAFCWGMNTGGKLGIGSLLNLDRPAPVASSGVLFAELGVGDNHSCGRTAAGAIYCWGTIPGSAGEPPFVPEAVPGGRVYSQLSVGGGQVCGYSDGIWCWGSNEHGQLGVSTDSVRTAPLPLLVRRGPPAPDGA